MKYPQLNKLNLLFLASFIAFYLLSIINFLLFHSIIEIFGIVVAGLIFVITLSARKVIDNSFILIIGAAYFFIGIFDLLHTLSYSGLNVFPGIGANLPTQLWLAGRFTESLTILAALFLLRYKFKFHNIFLLYAALGTLVLLSIFYWDIFPTAYIDGQGLSAFKVYSEYFISAVLVAALLVLYAKRREFNLKVFQYLNYSIVFTIAAEIVFTLYISVYDAWNMLGHLFKLISYYYIYKSVAETGIQEPQTVIFNNLKKSEDRLAKSEKKYKDLFSNMNAGFALHRIVEDERGRPTDYEFVEVNDSFRQVIGLAGQEIVGRKITEIIPDIRKDPADWIGRYAQTAKQGKSLKFEQYSEALKRWFLVNAYSPQPGYFATIVEDITERKAAEKELKSYTGQLEKLTSELFKFQLAVEDASEAIIITDPKGVIVYANKATEATTGFTDKEIIGGTSRLWGNILPSDSRDCGHHGGYIWSCLAHRNNRFNGEVVNRRKDGKEYYSYLTVSPVLNELKEVIFFVCIERDITKLKEAEKAKSDFVYFVSHELKTPLAGILMSVDLLYRGAAGSVPAEQAEYLDVIRDAGWEMSEFIEDMLNVAKIESDTLFLENEPMDTGAEVRNLIDDLKMETENKKLTVKLDFAAPLPIIELDGKIFKLIIRNLLTNAVHYTPEGGKVTVSLRKNGGYLDICVADTGCGIPDEDQDKIFNKLFRSSNAAANKSKGSGLGLYIAKKMAEKIGVRIYFESKENQGSKFCVSLPLFPKSLA